VLTLDGPVFLLLLLVHEQGAVAHLAIGEVRFSVRKQLKAFFGDYKFQLFLSDVEVVLQKPPTTTSKKAKAKLKVSTHRNSASERRKWLIVATLAKYLKFSITELVFKVLEVIADSLSISFPVLTSCFSMGILLSSFGNVLSAKSTSSKTS